MVPQLAGSALDASGVADVGLVERLVLQQLPGAIVQTRPVLTDRSEGQGRITPPSLRPGTPWSVRQRAPAHIKKAGNAGLPTFHCKPGIKPLAYAKRTNLSH